MTTQEEQEILFNALAKHNIHRYDASKKLYKYVSVKTAKLILGNGSLKFSTPKELDDNDFELALLSNPPIEMRKKIIAFYFKKDNPNATEKDVNKYLNDGEGKKRILNDYCLRMVRNSYGILREKYAIFCATTSPNNSEMWNKEKYGDSGKGVCIEYHLPLFTSNYYTLKVFYDKEFKPFGTYNKAGQLNEVSVQRWYFTKKFKYEFEDEVRVFTDKGSGLGLFKKEVFIGIFYGEHTSDPDILALELLLKNGGYSFDKGVKAEY